MVFRECHSLHSSCFQGFLLGHLAGQHMSDPQTAALGSEVKAMTAGAHCCFDSLSDLKTLQTLASASESGLLVCAFTHANNFAMMLRCTTVINIHKILYSIVIKFKPAVALV